MTFSQLPPIKANVLLVDDRPENLLALEAILDTLDVTLIRANSGREALTQVLRHDFAVILLDVQMPGIDGFETAALIKEREKSRHIPIIFVTAISKDASYVFKGYSAGAVDYIAKPFDPDILRSKVAVFVDLYCKGEQVKRQSELLHQSEQREKEREMLGMEREMERRHLEEMAETRVSLERFKETLDATLDSVFLLDAQTLRFSYVNQGALNHLGYSCDELLAMSALDIQSQYEEPQYREMLKPLMDGTLPSLTLETQHIHRDGHAIPVETFLQYIEPPVSAPPGETGGFVAIARDISERKQAEEALRESEARKTAIVETALDCIITTDCDGKIIEWNPAAEHTFGYTRAEVVGQLLAELIIPESYRERHNQGIAHYLATGEGPVLNSRIEVPALRADGAEILVELAVTAILTNSSPLFTAYLRDITARKRDEERLQAAKAEAERANLAKSEFISGVSHELRTPLNAIIGFSKLLLNPRVGPLNEDQGMYTSDIVQSAEHLLQLINDILDLSKIEAGKLTIERSAFSLGELLHESLTVVRETASRKELSLEVTLAPAVEKLEAIEADRRKVKQILYNLLSNAVKFTPEGGSITISATYDEVARKKSKGAASKNGAAKNGTSKIGKCDLDDPEAHVVIAVRDTGIGIAPENQARIFGAFEQVDSTYARQQQGTGLGLALTKRLVELHGGELRLESTPEKGSTFSFSLPLHLPEEVDSEFEAPV